MENRREKKRRDNLSGQNVAFSNYHFLVRQVWTRHRKNWTISTTTIVEVSVRIPNVPSCWQIIVFVSKKSSGENQVSVQFLISESEIKLTAFNTGRLQQLKISIEVYCLNIFGTLRLTLPFFSADICISVNFVGQKLVTSAAQRNDHSFGGYATTGHKP